jgi:hypothetical protein
LKFKRDFEITEEIQNLIDIHGEKYVEKILFTQYCEQIINSIKNKLNLEIEIVESTKQVLNEENQLEIIAINVFRFSIDEILIKKRVKKEKVTRKTNPTPGVGGIFEKVHNDNSINNGNDGNNGNSGNSLTSGNSGNEVL